jgi:DNA-binding transcriptional ArsR family regulator
MVMVMGYSEEIDAIQASILRALASPHRVRLVHLLSAGPRDVRDIAAALNLSQTATSQQLGALRGVGVVEATRDGRSVSYQLADPDIAVACNLMRAVLVRRLSRLGNLAATAAESRLAVRPVARAARPAGHALEVSPR